MKTVAKFLSVVTALVLLAGGYILWASGLKVSPGGLLVESAADRSEAFEGIRQSASVGSGSLTMFAPEIEQGPEQYIFITYTLRARNLNLLPAEWIQLEVTPQEGDVLLVKPTEEDVPAFNERLITAVLMTDRSTASHARSAVLSYYVYGHEYRIPVQLGAQ